jgi:hypothetical protein
VRRFSLFSTLVLCTIAAFFLRVYPLTIIQPFKRQDPNALQHALTVFRIAPTAAIVVALIALYLTVLIWKRSRIYARIGATLLLLLTCLAAGLTRVNVFELMFHPAGTPRFVSIQDTKTEPDDMLIAVALRNEAHAYPIREMAYHHVVNDWIAGTPIAATY